CTTGDTCQGSGCLDAACLTPGPTCVGGPPPNCDDNDPCTSDSCVAPTGCVHTYNPGAPCDDHNACTTNDFCSGVNLGDCFGDDCPSPVGCVGGPPANCDDLNPCTLDTCTPPGPCAHTPTPG